MNKLTLICCAFLITSCYSIIQRLPFIDYLSQEPDVDRSVVQIIQSRGFIAQVHQITTADDYILIAHRIVNPLCNTTRGPVQLQHGIAASSADWIINSDDGYLHQSMAEDSGNNLGFLLSKHCYDVWLTNNRGNLYSNQHKYSDKRSSDYWNFSFDEMAEYDLPAFIDYILKLTNSKKLAYIGHSQGTTQMFALLSNKSSKHSDLIKPFIALAPVVYLKNTKSDLVKAASDTPFLASFLLSRSGPFIISPRIIHLLAKKFCQASLEFICLNFIFLLSGFDNEMVNSTRVPVYISHTPAGTSNWAVLHYLQLVKHNKFAKMDYGKKENMKRYGQPNPPDYPLEDINNQNIALITGQQDWLSDIDDLSTLRQHLKVTLIDDYMIPYKHWNHVDYLYAKESGKLLNSRILKILSKYH